MVDHLLHLLHLPDPGPKRDAFKRGKVVETAEQILKAHLRFVAALEAARRYFQPAHENWRSGGERRSPLAVGTLA
jgi:hypothetical protein